MALLILTGTGSVWSVTRWRACRIELGHWRRLHHHWIVLGHSLSDPSADNGRDLAARLGAARRTLDLLRKPWRGRTAAFQRDMKSPDNVSPADLYLDLAEFTARLKKLARARHVIVSSKETFGFAEYFRPDPASAPGAAVTRQERALEPILQAVLGARPRRLVAVRRERARSRDAHGDTVVGGDRDVAGPDSGDFFTLDPRRFARVSGEVDTDAFQIAFEGTTDTLRRFLVRANAPDSAVVVDSVAAEPAERPPETNPGAGGPWAKETRFTVVVEFVENVDGGGEAL